MEQSFKQNFKAVQTIYFGLLIQLIFLAGIFYFVVQPKLDENNTAIDILGPVLALFCLIAGFGFFKNNLNKIKAIEDIVEKYKNYKSATIIRLALWEAGALFNVVQYLVTGKIIFFLYAGILVIAFLLHFPSIQRFVSDAQISPQDAEKLHDENFKFTLGNAS